MNSEGGTMNSQADLQSLVWQCGICGERYKGMAHTCNPDVVRQIWAKAIGAYDDQQGLAAQTNAEA